jgi:ribosomal protein S27AE
MELSAQHRKAPPPPPVPRDRADVAAPTTAEAYDDPPYLGAWRAYKKRWREVWLTGVLGFITLAGFALWLERSGNSEGILAGLFPVWGMVWFASTAITFARILGFSCPRCGGSFFTFGKPITSQLKCPHCGLRKFQVDDSGRALWQLKRPK